MLFQNFFRRTSIFFPRKKETQISRQNDLGFDIPCLYIVDHKDMFVYSKLLVE